MDRERWATVESLTWRLMEMPPAERTPTLDGLRDTDPDLAREVEALLAEADADPDFLDTPVTDAHQALDRMVGEGEPEVETVEDDLRIGPYRLIRPLGKGGMGEVHLAVQEEDGVDRYVAVKVIRPDLDTERIVERFRTERRILASLDHPSIARLFHVGSTPGGQPYLAMEYVEGRPVTDFVRERELDLRARVRLFQHVCAAVQHAHQRLVVHQDLKPANVVVTADGVPKLLDFGIAHAIESDDDGTASGGALTPEYASPEQRRGESVGIPSDVYALGVLLHEVLTDGHPTALHESVLEGASDEIPLPGLPADLAAVVRKAMHRTPERRYWTAATLAEDLERWIGGFPVQARPATPGYALRRFVRRNAALTTAAAALLVLLFGFSVVTTLQSQRIEEESARVAQERDEALAVRNFLLESFSATSPDQPAGDSVTAREILDRRAGVLETEYVDRPMLRAEMMGVLAEGYERLGLFADAEPLARDAIDLRVSVAGDSDPDLPAAYNTLGWIQHQAGRLEDAGETLREAVARGRVQYPDGHAVLARSLNDLGVNLEARGDYDEAEEAYVEALDMRRAELGDDDAVVAVTASNLSVVRYRKGDFDGAASMAIQARDAFIRALGPDNQRTMIVENNLAAFQAAAGDWPGARETYRDILDRRLRIYGDRHLSTAGSMVTLAATLEPGPGDEEAESLLRAALDVQREGLGPDHPTLARTLSRLAQVLGRTDQVGEAAEILSDALRIQRASLGPEHMQVAESLTALAQLQWNRDPAGAERSLRESVSIQRNALGVDHPQTAWHTVTLANFLIEQSALDEAGDLLATAWPVLAENLDPDHIRSQEARVEFVQLHLARGDVAQADSVLAEAERLLTERQRDNWIGEQLRTLRAEISAG